MNWNLRHWCPQKLGWIHPGLNKSVPSCLLLSQKPLSAPIQTYSMPLGHCSRSGSVTSPRNGTVEAPPECWLFRLSSTWQVPTPPTSHVPGTDHTVQLSPSGTRPPAPSHSHEDLTSLLAQPPALAPWPHLCSLTHRDPTFFLLSGPGGSWSCAPTVLGQMASPAWSQPTLTALEGPATGSLVAALSAFFAPRQLRAWGAVHSQHVWPL